MFFHLFFRTAALASYLFCTWFSSNFVLNFIIIVLLMSFDFWTVKNVSGRLLVGLRWWNKVRARFLCAPGENTREHLVCAVRVLGYGGEQREGY